MDERFLHLLHRKEVLTTNSDRKCNATFSKGETLKGITVGMFFLFVKTILFMLRVFKVIMTIFFHYYIIFLLCMNLTRPEPSNRSVFFYIRTYDIGTF
ncbi:hypothetical protein Hanom_Chr07g00658801 [Helianthus anomalus]